MPHLILLLFIALHCLPALADPPAYPDHSQIMIVRDEQGNPKPVRTKDDWAKRREHILQGMQQAMGTLPDREKLPELDVKVTGKLEREAHTRLSISFVAEMEGNREVRVPAFLYLPLSKAADGKRRPAMLALHQTHPLGKGDVDEEKGRTNRCYASELASRGYVVLAPDYPSFGDYKIDFAAMYQAGRFSSCTMKGIFNHMRAVDLLASRKEVDPERIGVIGHSLGGHNAMFVAAFDTRLKVIVSSCGWTPFHDYYGGKIAGWTSDRYMPRLRTVYDLDADKVPFDFYEVVAALAPRPFFSNAPLHDDNFDVKGVRKAVAAAKEVYRLFDAEKLLVAEHPDSGHDFPPSTRENAYRFIDEALRMGGDRDIRLPLK